MKTIAGRHHILSLAVCAALVTLSGCAQQSKGSARAWYGYHNGVAPKRERIYICHGFGCTYKTRVDFDKKDLRRLKSILDSGRKSPEAERAAISRAVQWQEERVSGPVGSAGDVGGYDMWNARVRGQMDCIDEATNTNSLLLVAEKHGYLRHHTVSSPVAKGFFLDGRYPHATATITERETGVAYAVDSWPKANALPPEIEPLDAWMSRVSGT